MKKMIKNLIAVGLVCSAFAVGGTAIAFAENGNGKEDSRNLGYAPDITVDFGEYSSENIPQAVKGKPYRLFAASAEDVYCEEVDVDTKVYLHYLEDTKTLISLENNLVTPEYYGVYTVEYKAIDEFGNTSVYTYDFLCEDVETLSITLSDSEKTTIVGTETAIADFGYENEFGYVTTKITATHENGKSVDLTEKSAFVPMYVGEYTIEYTCTDYNLEVKEAYTLIVKNNDNPVFLSCANMPKYFVVGQEYTLPSVEAYQFLTGKPASVTPAVTVQVGKENAQKLDGYTFIPEKEGAVTITYTAFSGANAVSQEYTARVIDVGEVGTTFDIAKYFYSVDALVKADSASVKVATQTDGARVEFINALPSREFLFEFSAMAQKLNSDTFTVYLQDSADESVQLELTYGNVGRKDCYFSINGESYEVSGTASVQSVYYNEAKGTIQLGLKEFEVPFGFAGFPSGKIYFSFGFGGVSGKAEIDVHSINNHVFMETGGDDFTPQIWFDVSTRDSYTIGDTIELFEIEYGDVLDSNTDLYLDIISPSEKYVTSEQGILLQNYQGDTRGISFRLTEYGDYFITLIALDGSSNRQIYSYCIKVVDVVAPQATLEQKIPTSLKVGEAFTVSDVIVTDNVSTGDKCTVKVFLFGLNGNFRELEIGKSYNLKEAGSYNLYYMIADEAGNTLIMRNTITVA